MEIDTDFGMTAFERNTRWRVQESYRRKYIALKRKCDLVELSNERVLNRLCHVKKYIHRLSRERRGLMKKLTELGDDFKKTDLTIPLEDDLPTNMLGEGPSTSYPPPSDNHDVVSSLLASLPLELQVDVGELSRPEQPQTQGKPGRKRKARESSKAEKQEKDPNAPKKPANAFLMYCQQERQKVQDGEGNGIYSAELSHQDLTRQLAKQWKYLSEEEKKHYYLLYEKEKDLYEREKDLYDKTCKKYTKSSGDKKIKRQGEDSFGESETIDVVRTGFEQDARKRDLKEIKITIKKSSNEDMNVDVEKDEFEFTDITVDEPKICLEKIDKSKLFDKTRLFGLDAEQKKIEKIDSPSRGVPVKDILLGTPDVKVAPGLSTGIEFRPAIPQTKGQRTPPARSMSAPLGAGLSGTPSRTGVSSPLASATSDAISKASNELTIKELVGVRASAAFEIKNQTLMELQAKSPGSGEGTVLATALGNKPMFDIKQRYLPDTSASSSKATFEVVKKVDNYEKAVAALEAKTKSSATDVKVRIGSDLKVKVESKPRMSPDSRGSPSRSPSHEHRTRPIILESRTFSGSDARSRSSPDIRARSSPDGRRMSLDGKKPVVEVKKLSSTPSEDPYHFDD